MINYINYKKEIVKKRTIETRPMKSPYTPDQTNKMRPTKWDQTRPKQTRPDHVLEHANLVEGISFFSSLIETLQRQKEIFNEKSQPLENIMFGWFIKLIKLIKYLSQNLI